MKLSLKNTFLNASIKASVLGTSLIAGSAFAEGSVPASTGTALDLVTNIDTTEYKAAILAAGGVVIALALSMLGIRKVIGMLSAGGR